jgi:Protein of unknown function (DUF3000)
VPHPFDRPIVNAEPVVPPLQMLDSGSRRRTPSVSGPGDSRWTAMCGGLQAVRVRAELDVAPAPAPARLAPHAAAVVADLVIDDVELATGRLVLLHEPAGHEAWQGDTRLVAYLRADLEPEIAADPLLAAVAWGWLLEALAEEDATASETSGTVTRVASEGFGAMAERASAQVELRASWTPVPSDGEAIARHAAAFGHLLCQAAGLPPLPPGVAVLPTQA